MVNPAQVQRYSFATSRWQSVLGLDQNRNQRFYTVKATTFKSKVYVVSGCTQSLNSNWQTKPAVVHCFDPVKNDWQQKASTCHPHFGSSLFVVNNRLCVAGGCTNFQETGTGYPCGYVCGGRAPVEVYDEVNNTWSVVEQKHIPPNKLGAVEVEGRVYFIINKFPIDSGIRIPPGEVYPVHLGEWDKLAGISSNAALCYLPIKGDGLCTE